MQHVSKPPSARLLIELTYKFSQSILRKLVLFIYNSACSLESQLRDLLRGLDFSSLDLTNLEVISHKQPQYLGRRVPKLTIKGHFKRSYQPLIYTCTGLEETIYRGLKLLLKKAVINKCIKIRDPGKQSGSPSHLMQNLFYNTRERQSPGLCLQAAIQGNFFVSHAIVRKFLIPS